MSQSTLFAAPNVLDGQLIGQCPRGPTLAEWLGSRARSSATRPKNETLHLSADNHVIHKHPQEPALSHARGAVRKSAVDRGREISVQAKSEALLCSYNFNADGEL